jgi:HK97 family phage major capsid protein
MTTHSLSFGQFLRAVARRDDAVLRSAQTSIGAEGGFSVPGPIIEDLQTRLFARSYLLSRVQRATVTVGNAFAGVVPDPSIATPDGGHAGGLDLPVIAEDATYPTDIVRMRALSLTLNKNGCIVPVTEDLIEDAPLLQDMLPIAAERSIRGLMERRIWNGNGIAQPIGVMSAPSLLVQAIEATQTIANTPQFIATNAARMAAQMLDLESAAFYVNPDLLTSLLTATTNGNARDVIAPPDAEAPFGRVATRPLFPNYAAPAVGAVGDFVCASMPDYLVTMKGDIRQAFSLDVRFIQGEGLFRFSIRWNGAPMLSSAYVPQWSSAPKSHYVALAARS